MSRISVRGFAVASATAVTTVGAAVGVASGEDSSANDLEVVAADASLLVDIPAAGDAQLHTASLSLQAESQDHAAESLTRQSAEETARKAAAEKASAKKEAAEKAAAEEQAAKEKAEREAKEKAEREAQEVAASRSTARSDISPPVQASYTKAEVQAMAQQIVGGGQYQCFSSIVTRESEWNHTATNPSSGAYGLMQALPGTKMASAGADWRTNPATQIKWGLNYMNERYGSPCGAWEFWQANHWY
ncbi:aggregation-promoting factor C-terminal-like domain-containing protein [Streptomyces lonarensis]|uniref:Transglycosylase SLT domain-containing protein n=1 Tax=Streptomyces lonarensis TaxID=700599 RepID=A0A7X6HZQ9_9ACTN|nr:transglycosylase SLT domain-containing protein [Streptomyces lonarensis]